MLTFPLPQPLADRIIRQVFEDIRGDVLLSYPGQRARTTADLFNRAGGAAFALYLNRISKHAHAVIDHDPYVSMSLMMVKDLVLECQQRMGRTYKTPHSTSLTQMFSEHPGAVRTFENFLAFFSKRSYVSVNPLVLSGLNEQKASFIPR